MQGEKILLLTFSFRRPHIGQGWPHTISGSGSGSSRSSSSEPSSSSNSSNSHIFFPLDCDVQTAHNFHPFSGKNLFSFWISANKIEHKIFAHESTLPKMFISMNCLVTTITEEFPTVPTGHLVATFSFRDSHFTSGTLLRIAKRFTDTF